MSLTYSTWLSSLATYMVIDPTNADFLVAVPRIIDDSEQRLYRELQLLSTVVRDTSSHLNANSRSFTLPSSLGTFVVLQGINVITPAGATVSTGTRNPLTPNSQGYIDFCWPSETAPASNTCPTYFAMITNNQVIVGPSPGQDFNVEVTGTIRPTPLSATNTTTYLTTYLPDLFFAESCIAAFGYQRDWGATSDDPQSGATWEAHYQKLLQSANVEEHMKRFASQAWTSQPPTPLATPPRA